MEVVEKWERNVAGGRTSGPIKENKRPTTQSTTFASAFFREWVVLKTVSTKS